MEDERHVRLEVHKEIERNGHDELKRRHVARTEDVAYETRHVRRPPFDVPVEEL